MPDRSIDELGQLQRTVMETVWDLGEATVHEVRGRLRRKKRLAYTTVLSVMQKLEQSGWLRHRTAGRAYVYSPTQTRRQAGASSLRRFIDQVFEGDPLGLFQQLVEDPNLSDEDIATLRKMLDRRRKERRDV